MSHDPLPAPVPALRVFVVDDEPTMLSVLSRALLHAGCTVQTASGGVDAVRHFAPGAWDLVVTDLKMPGMAGDELAAHLRRIDPLIPIILMTGSSQPHASAFPFARVLGKPFSAKELLTAVDEAIREGRLLRGVEIDDPDAPPLAA